MKQVLLWIFSKKITIILNNSRVFQFNLPILTPLFKCLFVCSSCFVLVLPFTSCNKEMNTETAITKTTIQENDTSEIVFVGTTWVEKFPEKFDKIADTIQFNTNGSVGKYFLFDKWNYQIKSDSIIFRDTTQLNKRPFAFAYTKVSSNEIIINNFIDRLISQQVKNITYIKSK